jgi:uncharacterized membrane protein YbhN (UPF0104 family)
VLLSYVILIQTWRLMLEAWDSTQARALTFMESARIWSVSNLGRYVPGKVWQIMSMSAMAARAGVSPVASAGSALLNTVVNIAVGISISLGLGWSWLKLFGPNARLVAILLAVVAGAMIATLPWLLPSLSSAASRISGRTISLGNPPYRVLWVGVVGNIVAWTLYGVGFQLLTAGVLGGATGALWQYIAVFTASYIVGYLFLFLPGGIGPREGTMAVLMTALQLANAKQALVVAVASRIWLTVLEIVPGLLFWASDATRRKQTSN